VNLLFVGHEASRTGAPMMLLHLLRWLRANTRHELALALQEGGPLLDEYRAVAPARVVRSAFAGTSPSGRAMRRAGLERLRQLGDRAEAALTRRARRPRRADLVYFNSVASARLFTRLRRPGVPVVAHVHELDTVLGPAGREGAEVRALLAASGRVVACAAAVRTLLVDRGLVPADLVDVVPECVGDDEATAAATDGPTRAASRAALGLRPGAFVICGSGTLLWRKGPDVFAQVARRALARREEIDVQFVWLGGREGVAGWEQLRYDAARLGLSPDDFLLLPNRPDPGVVYRAADAFALTSREDPYPLVCLENAICGHPVVCFDRAGGMPEFVRADAGVVVPYLDVDAMADALLALARDPPRRAALGRRASERAAEHRISVLGPRLLDVIERAVGRNLPARP
jgi:glycosyltransferase involved in cell wall biosynthesis